MDNKSAMQIIQQAFDNMHSGGLIDNYQIVKEDTAILGGNSILDSIGFITLFSEIEERIQEKSDLDIYLILDEISDFDINAPYLSAGTIASYIVELTKENN